MLELNHWFFAQLANFLLLIVILNYILYKPILKVFKARESSTKGALEEARGFDKEREELESRIDLQLMDTRKSAKDVFENLSREGHAAQKEALEEAQSGAVEINRRARDELRGAVENARTGLKADLETISRAIVKKLIG